MKRIFSFLLSALMLVSAVPMAQATNSYDQGTLVEYTGTGSEAYTITVPALLQPGQGGTVTLSGTWASDRIVTVTAQESVKLTNSINAADYKDLAVTFAGISKAGDNTQARTYIETVSVAAMPADALFGTWNGTFYYNVGIDTVHALYYGDFYTMSFDDDGDGTIDGYISMVFYEDGSVGLYENYTLVQSLPTGSAIYTGNQIDMTDTMGVTGEVSIDGTQIIVPGDDVVVLTHETTDGASSIRFGEPYIAFDKADNCEIPSYTFYENGTAEMSSYGADATIPFSATYTQNSVHIDCTIDGYDFLNNTFMISSDGAIISNEYWTFGLCDEYEYDGVQYVSRLDDDNWVLVKAIDKTKTNYEILSEINGKPVTWIWGYAFRDCSNMTSIVIPNSITWILWAFGGCSNLETVYYTGTEAEWTALLSISEAIDELTNTNIVYNYVVE